MYFLANVRILHDWAMIVVINTDQSASSEATYAGTSRDPPWPTSGHLVSGTHHLPLRRPIRAYLQSGYSSLESWRDSVPGEKNLRVEGGGQWHRLEGEGCGRHKTGWERNKGDESTCADWSLPPACDHLWQRDMAVLNVLRAEVPLTLKTVFINTLISEEMINAFSLTLICGSR